MGVLPLTALFWATLAQVPSPVDKVEISPNWCGAKCVWILAQANGYPQPFEEIREYAKTIDPQSAEAGRLSMSALCETLKWIGFHTQAIECTPNMLKQAGKGSIVVLEMNQIGVERKLRHALIYLGHHEDTVEVIDPFQLAEARKFTIDEFDEAWTGELVLVKDSPDKLLQASSATSLVIFLTASVIFWTLIFLIGQRFLSRKLVTAVTLLPLLFCGCSNAEPTGKPYDNSVLEFESLDVQLPTPVNKYDGEFRNVSHQFKFKNTSNEPVQIRILGTNCTCTTAKSIPEEVLPHGTGQIHVELDIDKKDGWVAAIVEGEAINSQEKAERFALRFSANVIGNSKILPRSLEFLKLNSEEDFRREIKILTPINDRESHPSITARMTKDTSLFDLQIETVGTLLEEENLILESRLVVSCQPAEINGDAFRDFIILDVRDGERYHIPVNGKVLRD